MIVKDISFADYSHRNGLHRAIALVMTEAGSLSLQVATDLPETAPEPGICAALAEDALRQIRRMPEFRSGQNSVSVSDTALKDLSLPS